MYEPISSIKPVNPETGTRSLQLNLKKKILKLQPRLAHVPAITRISSRDSGRAPDAAIGEEEEEASGVRPSRSAAVARRLRWPLLHPLSLLLPLPLLQARGIGVRLSVCMITNHVASAGRHQAASNPARGRPRARSRGHRVERRGRRRAHASCVTGSGSASADELP